MSGTLWDTMLLGRLRSNDPAALTSLLAARGGEEVLVPGPCVRELLYGLWLKAGTTRDPRASVTATWFADHVFGASGLQVVLADAAALIAAARLRAVLPFPPSPRRPGQSKPDQRIGWVADIEIAAIAWRWWLPLATANRRDFTVLAEALGSLYPALTALELREP